MPIPKVWFKLQPHVCDSKGRRTYEQKISGLGNRRPNIHGSTTKWCPLFSDKGFVNFPSKQHVVVSCQAGAFEMSATGLKAFMTGKVRNSLAILTGI